MRIKTYGLTECPECTKPNRKFHCGDRRPNSLGKFKMYETSTGFIIYKCLRCRYVFKKKVMGSTITSVDFSAWEKEEIEEISRGKENGE